MTCTLINQLFQSKMVRYIFCIQCAVMSSASLANYTLEDRIALDIFSVPVEINLPSDWKQIRQEQVANMYSAEFLPEGESLNQWHQLICVQGFNMVSDSLSPETFLESLSQTYNENCQGDIIYEPLGDIEVSGHPGTHALLGCTKMPNTHTVQVGERHSFSSEPQGEMGYYTVLMADDKLLLLHKSMRSKVFSPNHPPLSKANYPAFIGKLFPNR